MTVKSAAALLAVFVSHDLARRACPATFIERTAAFLSLRDLPR